MIYMVLQSSEPWDEQVECHDIYYYVYNGKSSRTAVE